MLWCRKCKKEYEEAQGSVCPVCGKRLKASPQDGGSWSLRPKGGQPPWPTDEAGEKEAAVFLTSDGDLGAGVDIVSSMLGAYGIPLLRRYPGDGQLGKVVLGFSGYGADLYVPKSMLELAQGLLAAPPEEEEIEGENGNDISG